MDDETIVKPRANAVQNLANSLIETADETNPIQGTDPASGADYDLDNEAAAMGLRKQDLEHPTELNSLADLDAAESRPDITDEDL